MDVSKIKEILKNEYGICDEKELDDAMSRSDGINLGIFTMPLTGADARYMTKEVVA